MNQDRLGGSAHALQAACGFAVMTCDNLYPTAVVEAVRQLPGHGLAGFRRDALPGRTVRL